MNLWKPAGTRRLLARVVVMLSVAGQAGAADAPPKPRALFNGRDLDGWTPWLVDTRHEDPRRVFTVTNGLIRISGDGLGYLATREEFQDFRLTVEWRWGTRNTRWGDRLGKARDSGIFLHAIGPHGNSFDGKGAFMAAIECNLFQGATGDFLLIRGTDLDGQPLAPRLTAEVAPERDADGWFTWQAGGHLQSIQTWGRLNWCGKSPQWTDTLDFRGPQDVEMPPGQWNRLEITAQAGTLGIQLNGTQVNAASAVWPNRGRILLQCEGSEIFFRRVLLTPLPPGRGSPSPAAPPRD